MVGKGMAERATVGPPKDSDAPPVPKFFERLAWPIPVAFAAAIASMRFEQGDVLFRDRSAYDVLEGDIPKGLSAIQVQFPKRSARAAPSEFEGDRRRSSWQSEVTIELVDLAAGKSETRVLSQGKLAMATFHGEEGWLDPLREEPPLPRSARELQQRLEQTQAIFDELQTAAKGCRFIFVVDLANDASRSKAMGVEEALRASGSVERIELSAERAGVEDPHSYHPTAVVRCLILPNRTTDEVLPILRARLYGGGASDDPSTDAGNEIETWAPRGGGGGAG
jgi:hypothetical protein